MAKNDTGYKVLSASNKYINSPNVLYVVYDLNSQKIVNLTIPTNKDKNFQCNSKDYPGNNEGYCMGDFVSQTNSGSNDESGTAVDSINNAVNTVSGFLGSIGGSIVKSSPDTNPSFKPYPAQDNILIAQNNSDLLNSQITINMFNSCKQQAEGVSFKQPISDAHDYVFIYKGDDGNKMYLDKNPANIQKTNINGDTIYSILFKAVPAEVTRDYSYGLFTSNINVTNNSSCITSMEGHSMDGGYRKDLACKYDKIKPNSGVSALRDYLKKTINGN
jgi:hypothetical protein